MENKNPMLTMPAAELSVGSQNRGPRPIQQNPQDQIDLVDLMFYLLGYIWYILAALVVGGVVAFAYTYFLMDPQYKATAKIYIATTKDSLISMSDLQLGTTLAADYKEMVLSREVLRAVSENLEERSRNRSGEKTLSLSYKALPGMINITNPTGTRILCLNITCNDPVLAANIANELALQAQKYIPTVMKVDEPSIYEPAIIPSAKSGPSFSRNTLLGAMAGAVVVVGILCLLYLMNDAIVTPEDVERYLGVQPLVTIRESGGKKKGYGYGYGYGYGHHYHKHKAESGAQAGKDNK